MNSDEEMPDCGACMSRGRSLMGRSRYADAAEWFTQAIRIVPSEDTTYALLAICRISTEGQEAKAVETAARAVSLSPEDSFNRSIYSLSIGASAKEGQDAPFRQALLEATEAIRLDPESGLAHTALARAQVRLKNGPLPRPLHGRLWSLIRMTPSRLNSSLLHFSNRGNTRITITSSVTNWRTMPRMTVPTQALAGMLCVKETRPKPINTFAKPSGSTPITKVHGLDSSRVIALGPGSAAAFLNLTLSSTSSPEEDRPPFGSAVTSFTDGRVICSRKRRLGQLPSSWVLGSCSSSGPVWREDSAPFLCSQTGMPGSV